MERYMFTRRPQRRVRVDYYCLPFVLAVAHKANTPEAEVFIAAVWLAIRKLNYNQRRLTVSVAEELRKADI
ncbi:MAG: hypothetical protein K6F57_01170 [Candidatus Saccharibacteria bacterium]|nr:hypothetical protein [Candidatus Saccharibacteria bacterium]